MAGLLDSDFMRFLTNNQSFWDRRDEAEAQQQYQGLLGSLEQAGPVQPGGVLESRAPDQQFWLKVAGIQGSPQLAQLANQQLGYDASGAQALGRQMQQQEYEAGNLSMAQRIQLQLQQARDQFAERIGIEDLQRKWYGTNASAGASAASAQNSQMSAMLNQARLAGELQKQEAANGPLYGRLQPADQLKAAQQMYRNDAAVSSAIDVVDWAQNRAQGGLGTGKAGAFSADWKLAVMPVLKDMVGAGALDEGERKWFEELAEDPSDKYLSSNQINKMKLIAQKVADYRQQGYQALGVQAPEIQGRGAVSRSLGAQPQGKVMDYTPTPKGLLQDPYRKR